jgi:transketolase
LIEAKEMETFCKDNSRLGVHPEAGTPTVHFSTGSLGMGLSVGAGMALSTQVQKGTRRTFVLLSDAECDEGSIWEAVMFAAQHKLSQLTAIIDDNGMQAMGPTRDILDLSPMADRWRSFGWETREVDGHDEKALEKALAIPSSKPLAVIARTVPGKGVSFMEGKLEWHYYPVQEDQARQALKELGGPS